MGKEMPIVDRGGHTLGYGFGVKNPSPEDPALRCPLRGLQCSFPLTAVCWSDGVLE